MDIDKLRDKIATNVLNLMINNYLKNDIAENLNYRKISLFTQLSYNFADQMIEQRSIKSMHGNSVESLNK